MPVQELFVGSAGRVFATACIIVVLVMMLIVSWKLFISRRKKAYFSLSASIILIIIHYLVQIILEFGDRAAQSDAYYFNRVLEVAAFILINMGLYQLYNLSRRKVYALFLTLIVCTALIAALHYYALNSRTDLSDLFVLVHSIWIELYLLLLVGLSFFVVSPAIGQHKKYNTAQTVYFIVQSAHFFDTYLSDRDIPWLSAVHYFLPVVYYIIVFTIIFERVVDLMQATFRSSITDGLTGLFNRRYLFNRAAQCVRNQIGGAIVFFDIDNFKQVNDTQGHHVGDAILKQVAEIIQEETQGIGIGGRYGGEELVTLLTDPKIRPSSFAERIRLRVERETDVTVSAGYSKLSLDIDTAEWIKQADDAMYHSKRSGKNRVTGYQMLGHAAAYPLSE